MVHSLHPFLILGLYVATIFCETVHLSDDYTLEYELDPEYITLTMTVKTTGWVAFCFGEQTSGSMGGCDIVKGYVDGTGNGHIKDMYALGLKEPLEDESQDWELLEATEEDGVTSMKVRRLRETDDGQDRPLEKGPFRVAWAYGESDTFVYHGAHRSLYTITFESDGFVQPTLEDDLQSVTYLMDYNVPESETTYACRSFDAPNVADAHIVFQEVIVQPENFDLVHHMLFYACLADSASVKEYYNNPGTCYSRVGVPHCFALITGWAVGGNLELHMPAEAGIPIGVDLKQPITHFVLEMHYDNPRRMSGRYDNSGIRLFYTEKKRQHDAGVFYVGDVFSTFPQMQPGNPYQHFEIDCPSHCTNEWQTEVKVYSVMHHMHNLGTRIWATKHREGEPVEEIERIDFWSFDHQQQNFLRDPLVLKQGDRLNLHCVFDTTSATEPVKFGEDTFKEMCMSFMAYYPLQYTAHGNSFGMCGGVRWEQNFPHVCGGFGDDLMHRVRGTSAYPVETPDDAGCQTLAFGNPDIVPSPVCHHPLVGFGLPQDTIKHFNKSTTDLHTAEEEQADDRLVDDPLFTKPPPPKKACGKRTELATGATVTTSSYNEQSQLLVDGDLDTSWSSELSATSVHWVQLKPAQPVSACVLRVLWGVAADDTTVSVFTRGRKNRARRWHHNVPVVAGTWSQFELGSGLVQSIGVRSQKGTALLHIAEMELWYRP
eukprot:TRINITY_DN47216_c0_g1_i1.p1 TRINITY_DN47216_c0_g1~~TRINITY_DN47216_c0_g1_i1.p1  ORF type:complete len:713 (-),score=60.34 TRINITY_DN47216_c0_g1_i1:85-2223(-)